MRRHLFFIILMTFMIGTMIFFAVTLREQNLLGFRDEKLGAQEFLKKFRETHSALAELNLSSMYGGGTFQLLHPVFMPSALPAQAAMPNCANIAAAPKPRPTLHSLRCEELNQADAQETESSKQIDYERILNGEAAPSDFILNPPFTDQSGASYASLLARKEIVPFNRVDWVREHLSFFKSSELKEVLNRFKIDSPAYEIISRLSETEIKLMVEGEPLVITPDFLLIKNDSRLGFSPLSYWAYDLLKLKTQLRAQKYDLVAYSPEIFCLERSGNACWTYNSRTALSYVYQNSVAILIFSAIVFLILVGFYVRYAIDRNQEQQRHRTSLQVLSHEFRTPVTSMLLLIEELTKNMSDFQQADQDLMTKVSAEIYKLQRVIEMSRVYLQSTSNTTSFKLVTIPSINSWIEEFATDMDARMNCEYLTQDESIEADPFWLRFALANLVQNAFSHGQEPVTIRLNRKKNRICISVEDEGICEFDSLKKMRVAFAKSSRSRGMGLGLNITYALVSAWGGELQFRNSPTSFSIALNSGVQK